jgi:hypothetical protein
MIFSLEKHKLLMFLFLFFWWFFRKYRKLFSPFFSCSFSTNLRLRKLFIMIIIIISTHNLLRAFLFDSIYVFVRIITKLVLCLLLLSRRTHGSFGSFVVLYLSILVILSTIGLLFRVFVRTFVWRRLVWALF